MAKECIESSPIQKPEALRWQYGVGVIMPYSSDLNSKGEPTLSKFSTFATIAAWQMYKDGVFKKFLLCGEQTFGPDKKSTSDLMRERLLRLGVPEQDIDSLPKTENLNNTAFQIKALSEYQKTSPDSPALVIGFGFHNQRIQNHMQGFKVKGTTISAEATIQYYLPKARLDKLDQVFREFERKEKLLRELSKVDKRGIIPRSITGMVGARVNNYTVDGQRLHFVDTTARKRQRQLQTQKA